MSEFLKPNRKNHVVLYAILRRIRVKRKRGVEDTLAIIVPQWELLEEEYPVRFYGSQALSSTLYSLEEKGYIEKMKVYRKTVGYTLTEEGMDIIEEMGKPKQYQHTEEADAR